MHEAFQRMDGKQGLCMGCGEEAKLRAVYYDPDGWFRGDAVSALCETCVHVLAILLSYPSVTPERATKLRRLIAKHNLTPADTFVGIDQVADKYLKG